MIDYPVAYRQSAREGGFQTQQRVRPRLEPEVARANARRYLAADLAASRRMYATPSNFFKAASRVAGFTPIGRALLLGLTAYELWQFYQDARSAYSIGGIVLQTNGWTKVQECSPVVQPPSAGERYFWQNSTSSNSCLTLQALPLVTYIITDNPSYSHPTVYWTQVNRYQRMISPPDDRWSTMDIWERPVGMTSDPTRQLGPQLVNEERIAAAPLVIPPMTAPAYNPQVLHPFDPQPAARAVPWRHIPSVRRHKDKLFEDIAPSRVEPELEPLPQISLPPRPPVDVVPHLAEPPGRRVKERKFMVAVDNRSFAGMAINLITESADLVNALFYALPRKYWEGWKTPPLHVKMALLYRHYDKVNVEQALNNILDNNAADALRGRIGRLTAKANRRASNASGVRIQIALGPAL